ncbi:MAG TPA: hypothetical protein VMF32_14875 [Xanthobacteraceae bacterium]|nr:hypothetical protein [Xanthobacteraceae bacterium]
MPRISKAQRESDRYRIRAAGLASESGWHGYEAQRQWLEKILRYDPKRHFTEAEREAIDRIAAARTMFDGRGGYSVAELIGTASQYMADYSYEDEVFLKELQAEAADQICLDDMRQLVGLCRLAGLTLPRFRPVIELDDEAA